uniref:Uncharacterized protein n=1 Tax=Leersia perrieri TaxID=77586 RepID=A0A0D9VVK5_9ORYZ
MASRPGAGAATESSAFVAPDEFEFCVLPSGGLAIAGADEDGMCVADEVFSDGKLLPFRLSSVASADAAAFRLLRSDSCTSGFSSRSDSRSASSSSSSSSSSCVSRSASQKSASSDCVGARSSQPSKNASPQPPPSRRSLFYASPSPRPNSQRWSGGSAAAPAAARRSTGSAPPASWGLLRLGVVGAPDVYPARPAAARGGSRSARFERPSAAAKDAKKKLPLGFLGAGLVCNCSADAVEPVASAEAAAAARRKAAEKNIAKVNSGQSIVRRSRILEWMEELSISKEKIVAPR